MSTDIADLKDWRFEIDVEKIAWAIIDREGESMNSLSTRSMEEANLIIDKVEEEAARGEIKGLVIISGKENNFVAGADIGEFDNFVDEDKVREVTKQGTDLLNRLENIRVPVVAAIHGPCLGGGLELAMACHYRIATKDDITRIGLPEVNLGIFPGLNGTVRSIRLAGAMAAMTAMLTGKMHKAGPAKAMGLVDKLVDSHHQLHWAARKAVLSKAKSKGAAWWTRLMKVSFVRKFLANQMRKQVSKRARQDHYPSPYELIKLFEEFGDNEERMAAAETRMFAPLLVSETSRNLRRVFRLMEMLKGLAPKNGFKPLRVHVIGAGTMGADIASWCVVNGMEVSLQDMNEDVVAKAVKGAEKLFKKRLKKPVAIEAAKARLIADVEGKHIPRADLIIEAIVENLEIKQKVFKDLEERAKPEAVLASNTSSLPIEDIASVLKDPGRLVGIHFFNPVSQMPLVEVIKSPSTKDSEVEKATSFVAAINKFPVIVKSCPGFLVNRVLAPYMFAAVDRYQAGVMREKIDAAAIHFGMPMGPLELCDIVGLDVCKNVSDTLGFGVTEDSDIGRLYTAGKLGKKAGEGFYVWENNKPKKEEVTFTDAELEKLGQEIVKPLLEECKKCLEDGIVDNADLVDAGVIFGTGFAPFRGGPLHYLESQQTPTEKKTADAA